MKMLRLPEVMGKTGRSRSSALKDIQDGLLPEPISIGSRAVAWPESEIDEVMAARLRGKSQDEIKSLVASLIAERNTYA